MNRLLKSKEVIKAFYEKYDRYLDGVGKFTFALCLYLTIMYNAGYNPVVTNPVIAAVMALISALLPVSAITVISCLLIVFEFYSVAMEVALIVVFLICLMMLLYFVFRTGKSWLLSLTLLFLLWDVPAAILPVALILGPADVLVSLFGIVVYGMVVVVKHDISVLVGHTETLSTIGRINLVLSDLFTSSRLVLLILAICGVMLFISILGRSKINYAPHISSVIGGLAFAVIYFAGSYALSIKISYIAFFIGLVLCAFVAFLLIFFVIGMDYKRTEQIRFEDDDYYYFVKAVPKRTISLTEKKVENITESDALPVREVDIDMNDLFIHKENEDRSKEER